MNKTRLRIPKMDCAAEERLVRMAVQGESSIHRLDADLSARTVDVYHDGSVDGVVRRLEPLKLGVEVIETSSHDGELGELAAESSAIILFAVFNCI